MPKDESLKLLLTTAQAAKLLGKDLAPCAAGAVSEPDRPGSTAWGTARKTFGSSYKSESGLHLYNVESEL